MGVAWNPGSLEAADPGNAKPGPVQPTVTMEEVRSLYESGDLIAIDARSRAQYETGHIPGAIPVFQGPSDSILREVRRWIPFGGTIVVVGQSSHDFSGLRVAAQLRFFGHASTRLMEGGMDAWRQADLPTVLGWDMESMLKSRGEAR